MSKSKPVAPRIPRAQQAGRAARRQHRLEPWPQPGIFAAQVQKALAGAGGPGGEGHALEHQLGVTVQQHPVLEGAGLALVGVAHHHLALARRIAAGQPFHRRGKARPPRPRSREACTWASQPSRPSAIAAASAEPGQGAK